MCSGSEAGSYLKLVDFVFLLNSGHENNEEEEDGVRSEGLELRVSGWVQGLGFTAYVWCGGKGGFRVHGVVYIRVWG